MTGRRVAPCMTPQSAVAKSSGMCIYPTGSICVQSILTGLRTSCSMIVVPSPWEVTSQQAYLVAPARSPSTPMIALLVSASRLKKPRNSVARQVLISEQATMTPACPAVLPQTTPKLIGKRHELVKRILGVGVFAHLRHAALSPIRHVCQIGEVDKRKRDAPPRIPLDGAPFGRHGWHDTAIIFIPRQVSRCFWRHTPVFEPLPAQDKRPFRKTAPASWSRSGRTADVPSRVLVLLVLVDWQDGWFAR